MASQPPIFRTIEVAQDQHITLGEPLSDGVRQLMKDLGNNQWQMRTGTFGHAASIIVQVSDAELVQTMNFAYDPGTDYTVLVGRYEEELGPPTDRLPDATQSAVWQDRQTRFEVFERGASVGSFMQDLAGANS
jgi:hypothetical protein